MSVFADLLVQEKQRTFFGIRVSALVETIAFIAIVLIVDYLFAAADRFQGLNPHPFWIIVLLVTVQYGTVEGIVAAIFSTIALYVGNIPEIQFNESLFQYNARLALNPALWFVAALVLGEIHMRLINERDKLKEVAVNSERNARDVTEAYQILKEKKEHLEVRFVSQVRSFSFSIKALQNMESMSPAQIFMSLLEMVNEIIGPKKFSIYTFSENGFEVMLSEGWGDSEPYQRRFLNTHPIYTTIVSKKHLLCVTNPEDEAVLGGEGLVASPIIDNDSGTIYGMLKIEEINFYDLNISTLWVVDALTDLIGAAFANAQTYDWLSRTKIYASTRKGVYSYALYRIQKEYVSHVAAQLSGALWELDVTCEVDAQAREEVRADLEYFLLKGVPALGEVFQLGQDDLHYSLLIPGRDDSTIKRLKKDYEKKLKEDPKLHNAKWRLEIKKVEKASV